MDPVAQRASGVSLLIAAFTLAFVSSAGQTFFVGLFAGEWQQRFDLGHTALGGLYSAVTLASGLLMFSAGGLSDRLPSARYALITLALLATGCLLMGHSSPLWLFVLALFLVRFAGQGLSSHLAVTLPAKYRRQSAGRGVAGAHYGHIGGEALLPPLMVSAVGSSTWIASGPASACCCFSGWHLPCGGCCARYRPPCPGTTVRSKRPKTRVTADLRCLPRDASGWRWRH